MVRFTYSPLRTAEQTSNSLFNIDILNNQYPLTKEENDWVRQCLRNRRRDIRARIFSVYVVRGLVIGVCAFLFAMSGLILNDVINQSASLVMFVFFALMTCVIVGLYVFFVHPKNRKAMAISRTHLKTDPKQTATPVIGEAAIRMSRDDNLHCTMYLKGHERQSIPLQAPIHWAQFLMTDNHGLLPMRFARVEATGTIASFESMIDADGTQSHTLRTWTHLSDAEYILLDVGPLSIDAERQAGLRPIYGSGPTNSVRIAMFLLGGLWLCLHEVINGIIIEQGLSDNFSYLSLGIGILSLMPGLHMLYTTIMRERAIRRFYHGT